jgi:hypothetical protein
MAENRHRNPHAVFPDSQAPILEVFDHYGATEVATPQGLDSDHRRGHSAIRPSFAGPQADIVEAIRRLKTWLR